MEKNNRNNQMTNILKGLFRYNPFFPLSKKDKVRLLGRYETARDKYLPLIEERTGVDMGEVSVTDLRLLTRRIFEKIEMEEEEKINRKFGRVIFHTGSHLIGYPISELCRMYKEETVLATAYGPDKSIGVSFGFPAKAELYSEFIHGQSQHIDKFVLHELTHHLWYRIAGEKGDNNAPKLWKEGYAVYGEFNWFADFLPNNNQNLFIKYPTLYLRGRDMVDLLVHEHGKSILLEIPLRWKELERRIRTP